MAKQQVVIEGTEKAVAIAKLLLEQGLIQTPKDGQVWEGSVGLRVERKGETLQVKLVKTSELNADKKGKKPFNILDIFGLG